MPYESWRPGYYPEYFVCIPHGVWRKIDVYKYRFLTVTDVTEEIYAAACKIFHELWDKRTPLRQIGIHTSKVESDAERQYNLFDLQKYDRLGELNWAADWIKSAAAG